jgi:hypothetical protein
MNENNNRVRNALSDTEMEHILTLLQQLSELLKRSMTGLSPAERRALPRIGPDNKAFVLQAINEMRNPVTDQIIPGYLAPEAIAADLKMYEQMDRLHGIIATLAAQIDSTRIMAGSEAFSSALSFKKLVKTASAAGIAGTDVMAQNLSERFKGQGPQGPRKKQ